MKAFITGITGFAGSFLAEELLSNQFEVSGTSHKSNLPSNKDVKLHELNLLDEDAVRRVIAQEKPDIIFHLAALSFAGDSFSNPKEFLSNNIDSQLNLLQSVKQVKIDPKVLIVSSAEVYGLVKKEALPIDEETSLNPTNPYAVSKLAQDFLGLQYYYSDKMQIIRVRPFNHAGPRQSDKFVISSFAKKIVEIEKGINKSKIISVGNLSSKRDFTDVRDVVRAYRLIIEKGSPGEVYNIGSGKSTEIKEILDKLVSYSKTEVEVKIDEALFRPIDNPDLVCDNSKIAGLTGWTPQISLEKTLQDTLDYWRNIL